VTMFLQMKLTPQPQATDKTQQRIFMFMPFIFLFFCYNFASALALYWTGQNVFSILQAQVTRLWQKDPVLEKIKAADTPVPSPMSPVAPFGHKQKHKKEKNGPPRPGGGGTNSKGKK
jgi:YidC/Oxa1 family membrane protein insertase